MATNDESQTMEEQNERYVVVFEALGEEFSSGKLRTPVDAEKFAEEVEQEIVSASNVRIEDFVGELTADV